MISVGDSLTAEQAMEEALRVAELGRGFVSPNPVVGCVIVDKNHRFLARGAHEKYGGPHAERNALAAVSNPDDLDGGTLYVTLEPCNHTGKTPPCVDRILQTSLASVVYGMEDPNPLVAGSGVKTLLQAGLKVGLFTTFQEKCQDLVAEFIHLQKSQFPYVNLKIASSMDGQMALKDGTSQWITGPESRGHGRLLRAHSSATMIGAGTFINDDPVLDFRQTFFEGKKKNRVVLLDPKGKASSVFDQSRLKKNHDPQDLFVIAPESDKSFWQDRKVHWLAWSPGTQRWNQTMIELRELGLSSLFVEGGSFAIGQFLKAKMFNQIYMFMAAKVMGRGMSWSQSYQCRDMSEVLEAQKWESQKIGNDLLFTAKFSPSKKA